MPYNINIIKSERKTFSLEIKQNLEIICRVPKNSDKKAIDDFINKNTAWLERNFKKAEQRKIRIDSSELLSAEEKALLKKQAEAYIPERVGFFAEQMGLEYGRVSIRMQKTRWGSCSPQANLSFNCLLMLTDAYITDYVIVHELCHIKEMNHSKKFWKSVEEVLPDYIQRREKLNKTGAEIMARAGFC